MNKENENQESKDQCNIDSVGKRLIENDLTGIEKQYFKDRINQFEFAGIAAPKGLILDEIRERRNN